MFVCEYAQSRWQNFGFCYCLLFNFLLGVGVIYIYFTSIFVYCMDQIAPQ